MYSSQLLDLIPSCVLEGSRASVREPDRLAGQMQWRYQCPRQRDVYDWRSAHSSGQHTTGVSNSPAPQQGEDTNSHSTQCSHTWVQRACCAMNSYLHFSVLVQLNSDAMIPAPPLPPQTSPLANMFSQESSRPEREPGEHYLTYYIDLSYQSYLCAQFWPCNLPKTHSWSNSA